MCTRVYALRIVSMDKILRFTDTLIIRRAFFLQTRTSWKLSALSVTLTALSVTLTALFRDTDGSLRDTVVSLRDTVVSFRDTDGSLRDTVVSLRDTVVSLRDTDGSLREHIRSKPNAWPSHFVVQRGINCELFAEGALILRIDMLGVEMR